MRLVFCLILTLLYPTGLLAAEYHIGGSSEYSSIGDFPWSSLVAGDTVFIQAKENQEPYFEHLYISSALQGTKESPIKIIGVNDEFGNQPILDGEGSTTGLNFGSYGDPRYHSSLGLLFFGPGSSSDSFPQWIVVSNLCIQNYRNVTTVDERGVTREDHSGSAVYIQGGKNITLDSLTITGGQDGVFAKDGTSHVKDIILKNCHIFDNGVSGSYLYHNLYTEVENITIENNHFGPPSVGSKGNNIKDRSVGTVIRYNYIEDGGHLIDLVECQDKCDDHTSAPGWDETFVYGNVLHAGPSGPVYLIHFGTGDLGADTSRWRKKLYFYHNTVLVVRDRSTSYYVTPFQISSSEQTVFLDNNIIHYRTETSGRVLTQRVLQFDGSGTRYANGNMVVGANWITPGWTDTRVGYTVAGNIVGLENIISPETNDPLFIDSSSGNYGLRISSKAVGAATQLPLIIRESYRDGNSLAPLKEYVSHLSSRPRLSNMDIGAYEYSRSKSLMGAVYLLLGNQSSR